jgi:Na+/H+ antiporter NhaD/arsenite permease-like protein
MIMLPFAAMLLCIAFAPLILKHHWERHYHRVSLALAAITCGYYLLVLQNAERVRHAALDYFSFMSVVASLFVVAGGIHIRVKGEARPAVNALFLFIGALLANVIGTTGASMLLIRPWISMNRYRFTGLHTAFFIFVVSNIGGALLPVGPPLFLGYMKGVPFLWAMQRCCLQWSITLAAVLLAFYFIDRQNYRRAPRKLRREKTASENWRFDGLQNVAFMAAILGALIFAPFGWRELIMIAAAAAAYVSTPAKIHSANDFTFAPVREVAWLFLGIFGTMVPVLAYMESHAAQLGLHSDLQFFWLSGVLSALLDNAPTYLTFLAAALGLHGLDIDNAQQVGRFVSDHDHYLVAISLGATFFGALTYIGNGPNFMVKAIAQHAHVHTPTFFGYLFKFALPVLLPIFVLISLFFFVR